MVGNWDRPGCLIAALCAAQVLFWTLAPALTHTAPPLDVVEMLVWGREGVVATHKHPNLPGLILEATRRLSLGTSWPMYFAAQVLVAGSFVAVYLLGRDLLGPKRAAAGTLLLTGIFYYSWPTPELNHNVVQMPLWAWLFLALWRATRRGYLTWWIVLGVFAGLAIWAKYSSALVLLVTLGWMLGDTRARSRFATIGPWIALAVLGAVVAPQVAFLMETNLLPIDYALARAAPDRSGSAARFLLAQLADHALFLAMAAAVGLFGTGATRRSRSEADARRFLLVMGLGPVLLAVAVSVLTGMGLRSMWGMPMFNLSGLLLLALLPGRFDARRLRRLAYLSTAILAGVPTVYAGAIVFRGSLSDEPARVLWPQAQIAETVVADHLRETGRPPRIIAGPVWEAGLVALKAPDTPSVLIDGMFLKSPWVSSGDLGRLGALAVWPTGAALAPELQALIGDRPVRHGKFQWTESVSALPIRLSWATIPAGGPERHRNGSTGR